MHHLIRGNLSTNSLTWTAVRSETVKGLQIIAVWFINAGRLLTRVFVDEHEYEDSTCCQLFVFWLSYYRMGRLLGIKMAIISYCR